MLYYTLFLTRNSLIVNTNRHVPPPRRPVRKLWYVVHLRIHTKTRSNVQDLQVSYKVDIILISQKVSTGVMVV